MLRKIRKWLRRRDMQIIRRKYPWFCDCTNAVLERKIWGDNL